MFTETITHFLPSEYTPREGLYVKPMNWPHANQLETSDWDKAQFRLALPGDGPIKSLAANIRITGRKIHRENHQSWIAVEIEFIGDCEPSTFTHGQMYLDW